MQVSINLTATGSPSWGPRRERKALGPWGALVEPLQGERGHLLRCTALQGGATGGQRGIQSLVLDMTPLCDSQVSSGVGDRIPSSQMRSGLERDVNL